MSVRFTRRDAIVAASAALLAIGVVRIVGADTAVMGSRAVAWETLTPEPTKVGEVRSSATTPAVKEAATDLLAGITSHSKSGITAGYLALTSACSTA